MPDDKHLDAIFTAMRTTIRFDDDVAKALERAKRERGVGISEAVNDLIRKGLRVKERPKPFVQRSRPMGLKIDVTNVAEALDATRDDPLHP